MVRVRSWGGVLRIMFPWQDKIVGLMKPQWLLSLTQDLSNQHSNMEWPGTPEALPLAEMQLAVDG